MLTDLIVWLNRRRWWQCCYFWSNIGLLIWLWLKISIPENPFTPLGVTIKSNWLKSKLEAKKLPFQMVCSWRVLHILAFTCLKSSKLTDRANFFKNHGLSLNSQYQNFNRSIYSLLFTAKRTSRTWVLSKKMVIWFKGMVKTVECKTFYTVFEFLNVI